MESHGVSWRLMASHGVSWSLMDTTVQILAADFRQASIPETIRPSAYHQRILATMTTTTWTTTTVVVPVESDRYFLLSPPISQIETDPGRDQPIR